MEHNVCKGCKWNNYPVCTGTIIKGGFMNIENLNPSFECGVKDLDEPVDYSVINITKIEEIENILDAAVNIKDNPPEIPRLDLSESKINEIIDFCNSQGADIEKI